MNKYIGLSLILLLSVSCLNLRNKKSADSVKSEYKKIVNDNFELDAPVDKINAVLILFGGYPEKAEDIEREFKILEDAKKKNIAVLYLNYNRKLWLAESEKVKLSLQLEKIFEENKLSTTNVYIGGFSSGGNITLLLSNHLIKSNNKIKPKGIFIVDSPVDLLALYNVFERNIERNFSDVSVQEGEYLINVFNENLGNPKTSIRNYELYSPYIAKTNYIENIANLNKIKIRFYTEPDTTWWKINRQNTPEDLNAFSLEKLTKELQEKFNTNMIELIKTENKGYRSSGERHPHSWSIVDKEKLIEWMLKE